MMGILALLGILLWMGGVIASGWLLACWVERKFPSKRIVRVTVGRVPWKEHQWYTFAIWLLVWMCLSALLHKLVFD